ncbi:MAG: ABC transporter ATP-binding protein [bacterium]
MKKNKREKKENPSLFGTLKPYSSLISLLVILTIIANGLTLLVPKIIARAIDTYAKGSFDINVVTLEFFTVAILIFIFTYLLGVAQIYTSGRVARDLRRKLMAKISVQDYSYIQKVTPSKLLTNLTSDIDNIKTFVSQSVSSVVSSIFLIVGSMTLLLLINWRLALAVLSVIPIIGFTFYFVFSKVRKLFKKSQEAIDALNKVINESILGSALIRLLNSHDYEYQKFLIVNTEAKNIGLRILGLFAGLVPVITFFTNIATLIILTLGGHYVIAGTMTLGSFSAFNNYLIILIFPIMILGFTSAVIAQATPSWERISEVLNEPRKKDTGTTVANIDGNVCVKHVSVTLGNKMILKDVSFSVKAGTKTAIIGPTAAGKTQLLYLLIGLFSPNSGIIEYDERDIDFYSKESLHKQVGFVFQDSIMFNLTLRENIAFSNTVKDEDLEKAIQTAELYDFIDSLPNKLDTIVSERGTSLSGGQKQRVMLARALALNPKVLLLDDFTARVDNTTEKKILKNIERNYPGITLISVTQKIAPIENYDEIILLMDGEILTTGTHEELMKTSPEYVQIYDSQQSTNNYESTNKHEIPA